MKHIENIISLEYGPVQSYDITKEGIKATSSRFLMKIKNWQLAKYWIINNFVRKHFEAARANASIKKESK